MESLQQIKARIGGIASTRQITQSMRLVSTSKVQKARSRMEANRPFLEESQRLLKAVAALVAGDRHPYLVEKADLPPAVVLICGDRGLCGGYNIGACREASLLMEAHPEARIITVGAKARDYCRRRYGKQLARSFTGISETPFFDNAMELAQLLTGWYNSGEIGSAHLVYTRFQSMLVQHPRTVQLLPVAPDEDVPPFPIAGCEPDGGVFFNWLAPFAIGSCLYGAILESSACEQSARIASMDSAVKNADDMIASLTLRYNQARQGAITQEITEIVGGANAVSGA